MEIRKQDKFMQTEKQMVYHTPTTEQTVRFSCYAFALISLSSTISRFHESTDMKNRDGKAVRVRGKNICIVGTLASFREFEYLNFKSLSRIYLAIV